MHGYAQTNLQLYNQLRQVYDEVDLAQAAAAYGLAMELFGGHFRPNGKPFVCHLIGTASVLASLAVPMPTVLCGLLHAAYTHGDFNGQRRGMTDRKRRQFRELVGEDVERLLHAYTVLSWNAHMVRELHSRIDQLSDDEQAVVLVRLANELEDYLDLGMAYCGKTSSKSLLAAHDEMLELARRLGSAELASELAQAMDEQMSARIPAPLIRTDKASFQVRRPSWLSTIQRVFQR